MRCFRRRTRLNLARMRWKRGMRTAEANILAREMQLVRRDQVHSNREVRAYQCDKALFPLRRDPACPAVARV